MNLQRDCYAYLVISSAQMTNLHFFHLLTWFPSKSFFLFEKKEEEKIIKLVCYHYEGKK